MIQKGYLTSVISKYYLDGMNEAVVWEIKSNKLTVKFTSPTKEMLGYVEFLDMPLEDSKIGIGNTSQLNKLIDITNGTLDLKYIKHKELPYKLIIADKNFTLNYTLADLMIIPKSGDIIGDINFNIKAPLDNESIVSIIKAKKAIGENNSVIIKSNVNADGDPIIELEFGGNIEHANKISFYIPNIETVSVPDNFKLEYNSDMIKEIMSANKDLGMGYMSISLDGIMKLEFQSEAGTVKSVYYLVAKES